MIIKTDTSEIERYLVDSANYQGFCDAVYFPESEDDIIEILLKANLEKQKVTIAGNGTGLTGARVPEGGIVIATDKLDKILEINIENRFAVVQSGVILKNFQKHVTSKGLYYPPDPTEQDCFIGATVATNASGAKSFKYGPTRNFVEELRIILPTGELIVLQRGDNFANNGSISLKTEYGSIISIKLPDYIMPKTKNSAGFFVKDGMDAIDLFIGSEGTLGVITQIKLALLNTPENVLSGVLFFNRESDAFNFTDKARNLSIESQNNSLGNIDARGIEFFDSGSLEFIREEYPQIPRDINCAIWFEQETNASAEETVTKNWVKLAEKHNANLENSWFAADLSELEKFTKFRHSVSAKVTEFISSKGARKVGTDTAVPVDSFRKYYQKMKLKVYEHGIRYICYGHIGDCHLHLNMLPEDELEFANAKEIYSELCEMAIEVGGTVSAEHGIGKLKRDHLLRMYGEKAITQMAEIKKSIDPNIILGVGNIFDTKYLKI